MSLHTRFERLDDLADLDKSIEYFTQIMLLTPERHPDRPKWLLNLGVSLHSRYEKLGDLADLDKNMEYLTQAISLTSDDHLDLPELLHDFGASLRARFEQLGDLEDIENSIEYKRRVVLLTPDDHISRPRWLDSLGASLRARFDRLGDIADLDQAIEYYTQAVSLTPEYHSDRAWWLNDQGLSLSSRFQHLEKSTPQPIGVEHGTHGGLTPILPKDLQDSVHCFQSAAESSTGHPAVRFRAALHWARLPHLDYVSGILPAYRQIMKIFPQLVWLGTPVKSRYTILEDAGSVSTEAAAAAIMAQDYYG